MGSGRLARVGSGRAHKSRSYSRRDTRAVPGSYGCRTRPRVDGRESMSERMAGCRTRHAGRPSGGLDGALEHRLMQVMAAPLAGRPCQERQNGLVGRLSQGGCLRTDLPRFAPGGGFAAPRRRCAAKYRAGVPRSRQHHHEEPAPESDSAGHALKRFETLASVAISFQVRRFSPPTRQYQASGPIVRKSLQ